MKATQPKNYFSENQSAEPNNIFSEKFSRCSSGSGKTSSLKQNYFLNQLDSLHKENEDLKATIQINKELLKEVLGNSEVKIRELIENNYWQLESQLHQAKEERDQARDELFIKDQIIEELKNQEALTIEQYEEQITELKENLERKEYGIQYKEQIWSTFEKELKKAIKKDSALYKKIQTSTQILVENLNETRISNVVRENQRLMTDQKKAISKIDGLIKSFTKLGEEEVWFGDKRININFYENENTLSTDRINHPHQIGNQDLSDKCNKLIQMVETLRNKYEIMQDENQFLRDQYARVSKANLALSSEIQEIQEKIRCSNEFPHNQQFLQLSSHASTRFSSMKSSNKDFNCLQSTEEKNKNGIDQDQNNSDCGGQHNNIENSDENYKCQRFTLKLHPLSPTKRMNSADVGSVVKEQQQFQKFQEFEKDIQKFLENSPDVFQRKKIHRNNSEKDDLSVISQENQFMSPCSPIDFKEEICDE